MQIQPTRVDFKKLDQLRDKSRQMLAHDKKYSVDDKLKLAADRARGKSITGKKLGGKLDPQQLLQMKLQAITARNPVQILLGAPSLPDISRLYQKNMPQT